jgi:DNA mismatch endonuclease (patch repair protein)
MDVFTPTQRSAVMRAIKGRDTTPELAVRRAAHALGLRFRLQRAGLPGKPDLVFPARNIALFVHGCFWHGHTCKRGARMPASNARYWQAKIAGNMARDQRNAKELRRLGWKSVVVWECETRDSERLSKLLARKLRPRAAA